MGSKVHFLWEVSSVMIGLAIVYPGDDGFWVSECPSLPGCVSQGESREKAIENIREAIDLSIEALQDDNLPVP